MVINQKVKYNSTDNQLDLLFLSLSDPTRRRMLEVLSHGEATVNQLADNSPLSLPAISKHLKVLEKAGLISRGRTAQWRPCRIEPQVLRQAADYMNQYRNLWEASLINLNAYVQRLNKENKKKGNKS